MMMSLIVILLVGIFLLPVLLIAVIRGFLSFFGFGRRGNNGRKNSSSGYGTRYGDDNADVNMKKNSNRKKIFDKNEGEYVDFEEIE
ncbi:MAG: DUF4834 family protein [Bacteroidaceae bacterium]|nr:DUF4834 family protein [Bacteroidaceae bacterium]